MDNKGIIYITQNISTLLNIPLRIYQNRLVIYKNFVFIKDPVSLYEKELFNKTNTIDYLITDDFFYYAHLIYNDYRIVYGPFRVIKANDDTYNKMALNLELSKESIADFINMMKSFNQISLEAVIQILCLINFTLTNKKITIKDILVNEEKIKDINNNIYDSEEMSLDNNYKNNTLLIENELSRIVETGDINKLNEWIQNAPAVRPGELSNDTIRHTKNTFIVTATIISRAAIKGNMDSMKALELSDMYIQKMELLKTSNDITMLQMNMVIDYTNRVSKIRNQKDSSLFLININKYILDHLSDSIKSSDICKALYISKSLLFDKIKKETNMTLSNYILNYKINESKELLKTTNLNITSISYYLGFSSQSHYNHAFKKFTGISPIEYRKKNAK